MATTVGLLHLRFRIPQAGSLKDKRRAVKGFKDRLRDKHNVSVSEVDQQDSLRMAVLAVAMVCNDQRYAQGVLDKIIFAAANHRDMVLLDSEIQWL